MPIVEGGPDYIVACSWSGEAFIIDQQSRVASFRVGESVTAFCCGMYTLKSNTKPVPCFVFITFSHKVRLFLKN